MPYPADGRNGLAEALSLLLSNAPSPGHLPAGRFSNSKNDDLQRSLSMPRKDSGLNAELLQGLYEKSDNRPEPSPERVASSPQALLLLDGNRLIRCSSPRARRFLALDSASEGRIFNYFFQPGKPLLIHIEREDQRVGVGKLLAVDTRCEGREAYLVAIEDITHRVRGRLAMQLFPVIG